MPAEAVGAGIAQRESRDPNLRYGVLDPACFKEDGGPSIAERINKELLAARLRPFSAPDNAPAPQRGVMGGRGQTPAPPGGPQRRAPVFCVQPHTASLRNNPALHPRPH